MVLHPTTDDRRGNAREKRDWGLVSARHGQGRGEIGREMYLENLSGVNQPLTVRGCIRLLRNGMLEVLHGPVCLYRDL